MIKIIDGDIFEVKDIDVIIHQANCFCTMGSGIAKTISKLYPEAVKADKATEAGDERKLGTFTYAVCKDNKIIVNMYSQYGYGRGMIFTELEAMSNVLFKIFEMFPTHKIAIPYGIGCGLGGEKWDNVFNVITNVHDVLKLEGIELDIKIVRFVK